MSSWSWKLTNRRQCLSEKVVERGTLAKMWCRCTKVCFIRKDTLYTVYHLYKVCPFLWNRLYFCLNVCSASQNKAEISQNFVAFSENLKFIYHQLVFKNWGPCIVLNNWSWKQTNVSFEAFLFSGKSRMTHKRSNA